jgi:hypothetical protein
MASQLLCINLSFIFLMSSQQSNERRPNRPLCHITLHARQFLRANTQRAANWFRKPSFPRFKLKIFSQRSHLSPYSHSSSTDDASHSIRTASSATLYSVAPQRLTYNAQIMRSSLIVPIMPRPIVRHLFFFLCSG